MAGAFVLTVMVDAGRVSMQNRGSIGGRCVRVDAQEHEGQCQQRQDCSPESSVVEGAVPAAAADGAAELDMVRVGRETLTPESLITMASRRVQGRGRSVEVEKRSAVLLLGGRQAVSSWGGRLSDRGAR